MMAGFCLGQTELGRAQRDFCAVMPRLPATGGLQASMPFSGRFLSETQSKKLLTDSDGSQASTDWDVCQAAYGSSCQEAFIVHSLPRKPFAQQRGLWQQGSCWASGSSATRRSHDSEALSNIQSQATGSWTSSGSPSTAAHSQGSDAFLGKTGPPPLPRHPFEQASARSSAC